MCHNTQYFCGGVDKGPGHFSIPVVEYSLHVDSEGALEGNLQVYEEREGECVNQK